jgi:hypothetical protein
MHEGMHPAGQEQQNMFMMEMWNTLDDGQKITLMKRMVDAKILMKESMIKQIQFKIETMKMVKKMLDECKC